MICFAWRSLNHHPAFWKSLGTNGSRPWQKRSSRPRPRDPNKRNVDKHPVFTQCILEWKLVHPRTSVPPRKALTSHQVRSMLRSTSCFHLFDVHAHGDVIIVDPKSLFSYFCKMAFERAIHVQVIINSFFSKVLGFLANCFSLTEKDCEHGCFVIIPSCLDAFQVI